MSKLIGPLLVGVAAALWATDALFRFPTVASVDPTFIVFFDHLVCVSVLLPWIYVGRSKDIFRLRLKEWMAAAFVGVGGSAIATVLFTASFRYVNPSVTILLQKLQPIMVVVIAYIFLGERPQRGFYLWAAVAAVSGLVLSFPDFDFSFISGGVGLRSTGVIYALTAATLWAIATVAGKVLLRNTLPSIATFWRYVFGLVGVSVLLTLAGGFIPWDALESRKILMSLLYISLIPGLTAMLAYYAGLSRTSSSVATFVELVFPVSAVILNTIFLDSPLSAVQIVASATLLFAVTKISVR